MVPKVGFSMLGRQNNVVIGCNDGSVVMYQASKRGVLKAVELPRWSSRPCMAYTRTATPIGTS